MLKLFKKKEPAYIDLESYDYSAFARDMTEEELLTVNGGKWIGNSNEAVAEGEVGDTLQRDDGTIVTITEGDIKWAQEQISSPSTTSTTTTTETSSSSTTSSESNNDRPREQNNASSTGGSRVNMGAGSMTVSDYIAQQKKKGAGESAEGKEIKAYKSQANNDQFGKFSFDPHNPKRILANLDDPKSLQAAAELLSDVNLGYTITAYGEKSGCVKNFEKYAEINEYLYKDPNYPGAEFFKKITYFHFEGRDARNIITESYEEIVSSVKNNGDWIKLDELMSIYHQNGIGAPEEKYVCKDGRKAVFTKDFSPTGTYELYTDPRYKGTYNYCNPNTNPIGHFFADMLPYYLTGCKNERNQ